MKSEERLVREIIEGDRSAMRELYDRYSGYAMAVGLRYVSDRDSVNDILQDSFIKVFSSIKNFKSRGEGTLKSWISRIVANEALDFLRRRDKLSFTDEIPDEAEDDIPDLAAVTDDVLAEMIGRLPDGYKAVLNMYVFEQLNHKEIAAKLGITPSTSASQFFHAKKMLAKMIKDYIKQQ